MNKTDWQRVSRRRPCAVCGKPDWCLYVGPDEAPTAAICQRVESPRQAGEGGWLHRLRDDPLQPVRRRVQVPAANPTTPVIDFAKLADSTARIVHPGALQALASQLGLSVAGLRRLGIGWLTTYTAWTFPMRSAHGQVVGIRLRRPDGSKLSARGGREGLFIPEGLPNVGRLLVCEGPTDCAALLDLRFRAVGRPSCTGGVRHLVDLVRRLAVPEMVIVADDDLPGQRGAEGLASVLVAYVPAVRIIMPPAGVKDARAWVQRGATAADVEAAIEAAPLRRLLLQVRKGGGRHE